MWNVFKFLLVWCFLFWLTFAAVVFFSPPSPSQFLVLHGRSVANPAYYPHGFPGLVLGFFTCIPAYFIARRKRVDHTAPF
jgi:hypothetical protein